MRRNTLFIGLLTTALIAASAPADAAVFVKLPGVEGEVTEDREGNPDGATVLSEGGAGDETRATAIEYGLIAALHHDPGSTEDPWEFDMGLTAGTPSAADSFFDVWIEVDVNPASPDSFFDIALHAGSPQDPARPSDDTVEEEAETPVGRAKLTYVPLDLGYFF
ncbi:MAG: Flp family type IVb pilin [Thermoplasmatota archaeon]